MTLIQLAHAAIQDLLADPKTPPAVRLRAAQAILRDAGRPETPESSFARSLRQTDQALIDAAPHDALRQLQRDSENR